MAENDNAGHSSETVPSIPVPSQEDTEDQKKQLLTFLKQRVDNVQLHYHDFLAELTYLQGGGLISEFDSWRRQRTQELMQALCSGHLDGEDLNKIGNFMSGHLPIHFMFPVEVDATHNGDSDEDSDDGVDVSCI